jgi:excisionase family DNA binding protein
MNTNTRYAINALEHDHPILLSQSNTYSRTKDEPFLSVTDLANLFKVHVRTVQRWVREGRLPIFRIGKTLRFRLEDVLERSQSA